MLRRLGSAFIGVVLLFVVYFLKNNIVFNIAVVIISIIALNEFYNASRKKGIKPLETIGYISCLALGLVGFVDNYKVLLPILVFALPVIFGVLSSIYVFSNMKIKFVDIATTIMGIIYVPMMLLFLILTWQMKNGYLLSWFIFGGAWFTDTFAYFIGKAIGKHKFSRISPNKSVEGCIGGLFGGSLFYGLYSFYLNSKYLSLFDGQGFNIVLMTLLGAFVSVISQIGDFTASAFKRECEIKDFGKIMPGHGGVLDRFDSIIMICPLVYFILSLVL